MNPDRKFYEFVIEWAKKRNCTFIVQGCDGRESPKLIDGMAADDIWGWMLPDGVKEISDDYFGCVEWSEMDGKLCLKWNTYDK